jgi:glucokinase
MLNDFHAVGLSLPSVSPVETVTIFEGDGGKANGNIGCIGPGTGLGEVYSVWSPGTLLVFLTPGLIHLNCVTRVATL